MNNLIMTGDATKRYTINIVIIIFINYKNIFMIFFLNINHIPITNLFYIIKMTNIQSKQNTTFIKTSKSIIINNISSLSSCQKRTIKKNTRKSNLNIFEFSINSRFIYEPIFIDNFFYNLKDNNIIKQTGEKKHIFKKYN